MEPASREKILQIVGAFPFVLFMKGTRAAPKCGFSASVVNLLDDWLEEYETIDVTADEAIREGVKAFTDWPTIPQLFVNGAFVGGADILREMAENGELASLLGNAPLSAPTPAITITDRAREAFAGATADVEEGEGLRFEIDGDFHYGLFFGPNERGDIVAESNGISVRMSRPSARRADGMKIDFVASHTGEGGFSITNPNEPPRVKSLSVEELKTLLDAIEPISLFDVRTDIEIERAHIDGAIVLDANGKRVLEGLEPNARIVFFCHHGVRSRGAAEHYLRAGFTNVWNLEGGIDAWSQRIDPNVPRY
jgi:monothiol glutaredoxin